MMKVPENQQNQGLEFPNRYWGEGGGKSIRQYNCSISCPFECELYNKRAQIKMGYWLAILFPEFFLMGYKLRQWGKVRKSNRTALLLIFQELQLMQDWHI